LPEIRAWDRKLTRINIGKEYAMTTYNGDKACSTLMDILAFVNDLVSQRPVLNVQLTDPLKIAIRCDQDGTQRERGSGNP